MGSAVIGAFSSSTSDKSARDLWQKRLGLTQGRLTLPLAKSIGGGVLPLAPPLPKLGGSDDPGRMVKDWGYYKFRPYESDLKCSMNKYGPDFRWPGLNSTPEFRHHLALVPRPQPSKPLPETYWVGMPRLELGPGHDFIQGRIQQEQAVERARIAHFFETMRASKFQLTTQRMRRETLEAKAFGLPPPTAP